VSRKRLETRDEPNNGYALAKHHRKNTNIYLFCNNQKLHSFVVLFMFQKEFGTFIQHFWVGVLIEVLGYNLKSGKLLRSETQIQCLGNITALKDVNNNPTLDEQNFQSEREQSPRVV